ncbi:MAG: ATP-binding protein [Bacteriovoracia bacterium]
MSEKNKELLIANKQLEFQVIENKELISQITRQERLYSLGTLAAGVAHEINNPLVFIITNLEELLNQASLQEIHETLHEINEGAQRIRDIVSGLKSLSREGDESAKAPVDLNRAVKSALKVATNEIRHRAILTTEFGILPRIMAIEYKLIQVFVNLIVNAAQAMPERDINKNYIQVRTHTNKEAIIVSVKDTGVGMDEDTVKHIFDPFFTTKPVGVGTGLGLSISHKIVTDLGGRMNVKSIVGEGTVFEVIFPESVIAQKADSKSPSNGKKSKVFRTQKDFRIMVIDDEELIVKSVHRYLSKWFTVEGLTNSKEALEILRANNHYDLIICDLMMPKLTGMDVYTALKSNSSPYTKKFIFISGGVFTEKAENFLKTEKPLVLSKPFTTTALQEIIQRFIEESSEIP